jgi:Flp pilus assembly protein TadD
VRAFALEPADSAPHALRAMILAFLRKENEARAAAEQAIALDPGSTYAWMAQANVRMIANDWPGAEESARAALAIDPEHAESGRILAEALRLLGKRDENVEEVARILARDPESAPNHAAAGWAALQHGDRKRAEQHFLEALRIRPDTESARQGLLESLKARSPIYRAYLAYSFFMQRQAPKMRWVYIIGVLVVVRAARVLLTGAWAPLGLLIGVLYFFFVLWVHLASGVGHLVVWLDRTARHALRTPEAVDGLVVGGFATLGIPLAITGAVARSTPIAVVGLTLVASAVPLAYAFVNDSKAGRIFFGASGAIALATGLAMAAMTAKLIPGSDALGFAVFVAIVLVLLSTWLSNVRALHR